MPQAGAARVEVRVAVDGPIRRHALALRPGHIAVLTGLRPLDANPSSAVGPPSAGLAAADPKDVDVPAQALEWTEVRMHPCRRWISDDFCYILLLLLPSSAFLLQILLIMPER